MATRVRTANPTRLHTHRQKILEELTQVCRNMAQTQKQITRLEKRIVSLMSAGKKVA